VVIRLERKLALCPFALEGAFARAHERQRRLSTAAGAAHPVDPASIDGERVALA